MFASQEINRMTPQEYLEWEEKQEYKHEYLDGEVLAMAGGTLPHNSIAVNLTSALRNHLRGKGCKVFMADAKLGVSEKGPFFYPDVMVTCDSRDLSSRKIVNHPCLVVEVLSPGTQGYDRGPKFAQYRRLETLQEYVLIDTETKSVECYRLNDRHKWELTHYFVDETTPGRNRTRSANDKYRLSLFYFSVVRRC
mgnify:CR=1 FL=1